MTAKKKKKKAALPAQPRLKARIWVTPKDGLLVRDPKAAMRPIPAQGKAVLADRYWLTHIREGSVSWTVKEQSR